jgi:hypothetical protein
VPICIRGLNEDKILLMIKQGMLPSSSNSKRQQHYAAVYLRTVYREESRQIYPCSALLSPIDVT